MAIKAFTIGNFNKKELLNQITFAVKRTTNKRPREPKGKKSQWMETF